MEMGIRVFLLILGLGVLVGVIWDWRREYLKRKGNRYLNDSRTLIDHTMDAVSEGFQSSKKSKPKAPLLDTVILLHLMAKQPGSFSGKALLAAFQGANLYFGDRQFHYYENEDGNEEPLFSVVSAIEPGFFELSKMEHFKTPGITLFFMVNQPNQSIAAFEIMLRTARQLSRILDGEIKDDNRLPLTFHAIEKYRERLRRKKVAN